MRVINIHGRISLPSSLLIAQPSLSEQLPGLSSSPSPKSYRRAHSNLGFVIALWSLRDTLKSPSLTISQPQPSCRHSQLPGIVWLLLKSFCLINREKERMLSWSWGYGKGKRCTNKYHNSGLKCIRGFKFILICCNDIFTLFLILPLPISWSLILLKPFSSLFKTFYLTINAVLCNHLGKKKEE